MPFIVNTKGGYFGTKTILALICIHMVYPGTKNYTLLRFIWEFEIKLILVPSRNQYINNELKCFIVSNWMDILTLLFWQLNSSAILTVKFPSF